MSRLNYLASLLLLVLFACQYVESLTLVMMAKRGGNLKKMLDSDSTTNNPNALNRGKGQEITGVTLPAEGKIKGWEFGQNVRMACANVNGRFYAVQGECPRCGFDLWKGDLIADDPAWTDLPRVACPTCATTYSFTSGKHGPPLKRTGLQAFVGNLAKTATESDSRKDAKAFQITRDEEGRVFCRE